MHCSIRQYRTPDASRIDEMMHIVDQGLADRLSEEPGFVSYEVLDCGDGQICSLTIFQDEEGVRRSDDIAAEFVREELGDFGIDRTGTMAGEVKVSRARSEVLEAVHA